MASAAPLVRVGIVGASGLVGKYLAEGFLDNGGYDVVLLTRRGGKPSSVLDSFAARGAKIVETDFDNEADLTTALTGLDIVVSAVGAPALASQGRVINAARAAGVKRYVPSEFGSDLGKPGMREYFPIHGPKYATRDLLEASGLEWTYITTGKFLETTFTPELHFDVPNGKATIKGNPDTKFAITSLKDIARWTAAVLLRPESKNATIFLKGEELSFNQAVKIIEEATGNKLEVTYISADELNAQIAAAPTPGAAFFDLLARAIADGWGSFPGQWSGQDAPSVTLATYAKTATWRWNA